MFNMNAGIHFAASNGSIQPWVLPPIRDREHIGVAMLEIFTKMIRGHLECLMASKELPVE